MPLARATATKAEPPEIRCCIGSASGKDWAVMAMTPVNLSQRQLITVIQRNLKREELIRAIPNQKVGGEINSTGSDCRKLPQPAQSRQPRGERRANASATAIGRLAARGLQIRWLLAIRLLTARPACRNSRSRRAASPAACAGTGATAGYRRRRPAASPQFAPGSGRGPGSDQHRIPGRTCSRKKVG